MVVGNVPFGNYGVADKAYDRHKFLIHDYFLAKSLDQVRTGGVVAVLTSSGTLDKKDTSTREYLAQRADLLGAIRLPNNAFRRNAGTDVVADILFLQKRDRAPLEMPEWVRLGQAEDGHPINQYFILHPEMVLGELTTESTQYGKQELTVAPIPGADLSEQLKEAISHIHGSIQAIELSDGDLDVDDSIPADPDVQNFSYTVKDGQIYFRENSVMHRQELPAATAERVKGMVALRDTVRTLLKMQLEDASDDAIHAFSHQYDELSGLSYTEILSHLSGDDAGYLHEWLGSIVAEDSTFSAQAKELQARLEAISPAITAPEQATPEAPDKTRVTYYVAECMEFHSAGEYHEGVSLEEALQLYSQIDPHRINGIPGIGIHVENNDRYEGEYELMSNGYLLTDVNNEIDAYRDNPYVQQATADLTAALAALPPVKEPVDRTAEPKEAIFDFNGRYLHMQLSADNDWDYTVYSRNMETLDGGRVGDAYTSFAAARADLMQEYRLTEPFKEVSPNQFKQMLAAHEESLHCPVCQLTLPEARAQGSLDEWRTSHNATKACARQFNEQYGDAYHSRKVPEFLNMMVARYGMERCKIVLASTIQSSPWDGRYHPYVRDGANQVKIPGASEDLDHDRRLDYLVSCHPVTVDVAFRDLMQMEKEQVLSDRPKAPQEKGKSQAAPASGQKRPSVLKKLADKQAEIAAGDSKAKPVDRDKPQL